MVYNSGQVLAIHFGKKNMDGIFLISLWRVNHGQQLAFAHPVANVLGLNKPNGDFLLGQDVVRCAAGLPFRLVGGPDVRHEAFDKLLEVAPEGVFGGIALGVAACDVVEVLRECHI